MLTLRPEYSQNLVLPTVVFEFCAVGRACSLARYFPEQEFMTGGLKDWARIYLMLKGFTYRSAEHCEHLRANIRGMTTILESEQYCRICVRTSNTTRVLGDFQYSTVSYL